MTASQDTLLVVDDSSTMRKIIQRSVRQAGLDPVEIIEAGDGREALAILRASAVDLILTDLNMPCMDGVAFIRAVTDEFEQPPPIIVITSERDPKVMEEALSHGASACLVKPFTPASIRAVLAPFLTSREP